MQEVATMQGNALQMGTIQSFVSYLDRGAETARGHINNLKQFFAWLLYEDISRPVRADVVAYREYLGTEHDAIRLNGNGWEYRTDKAGNKIRIKCKSTTIAVYFRSICAFFRWTAASNLYPNITENLHAPKVRRDIHRKEALAPADVVAIEQSIQEQSAAKVANASGKDAAGKRERATEQGKRDFAMYLLAVNCGLRTVELSRASVGDLEVKNGNAFLWVWGKGHTEADAKKPLAPEVYAALKDYLQARENLTKQSPLFAATGNRSGGQRIAKTTISTILKRAMQAAGYDSERITAHSLRHTAGTGVMTISENNIYTAQKYMRHADPGTTEIYLHNDTEQQETETAAKLYAYYHAIA